MPKMPSPSYQEQVRAAIDSRPTFTWTTRHLANETGLTTSQVGGALSHLTKKGLVGQARSGVGEYTSLKNLSTPVTPKATATVTNGRYETGTLFECAGYTEAGTLVLRSLDTGVLVPVKPHTPAVS